MKKIFSAQFLAILASVCALSAVNPCFAYVHGGGGGGHWGGGHWNGGGYYGGGYRGHNGDYYRGGGAVYINKYPGYYNQYNQCRWINGYYNGYGYWVPARQVCW